MSAAAAAATRGASGGGTGGSPRVDTGARGGVRCEIPGCTTQPRYAENGAVRPRFCGLHKLPGQMNIVSRCCKHPECSKVPHFGNDQERPLYCGQHKLPGMVNVANRRYMYKRMVLHTWRRGDRGRQKRVCACVCVNKYVCSVIAYITDAGVLRNGNFYREQVKKIRFWYMYFLSIFHENVERVTAGDKASTAQIPSI